MASAWAAPSAAHATAHPPTISVTVSEPTPTQPPSTENVFLPEDRGYSDCVSSVPRPGCGSKARGGWRQGLVFLAIIVGLTVIAWRVIASARKQQALQNGPRS